MAALQRHFEEFHGKIRLDYESNAQLAEKRDIVLEKIAKYLKQNGHPSFSPVLQGSYKMRTGVFPINSREYDIDVGLQFTFDHDDDVPTADEVRDWVYDAIKSHTDKVKKKTPCIRVHYKDDYPYHLDLVVYSVSGTTIMLATANGWVPADPEGLLQHVKSAQGRFKNTDGSTGIDQLRRTVRYLKRWGDLRETSDEDRPTGLAYTLLSIEHLPNGLKWDGALDDAGALRSLAEYAGTCPKLTARKPTPQYEDMFGTFSPDAMIVLKGDFIRLAQAIAAAEAEPDAHEACLLLQDVFGEDFPVPPKGSTGKKTEKPAIVTSSSSA